MDRLGTIETFVRVIETKSFSAAARDLRVGQPAVSKSIARLEERFGMRLLMRSTRRVTPTEAGRHFYEHARKIVDYVHAATTSLAGLDMCGSLRVSAGITIARLHIVPKLNRFLEQHPGLSLDLLLSDRTGDPIEEGADICLRTEGLAASSVDARKIATSRRLVVGTPDFFRHYGLPQTPDELSRLPAVIDTMGGCGGSESYEFHRGESRINVLLSGRLRVDAAEAVRAAVLSGVCCAVVSEWMFVPELASGSVRSVLPDWHLPPLDLWALFPAGRMVTAKARAFASFVEAAFCNLPGCCHSEGNRPCPRAVAEPIPLAVRD